LQATITEASVDEAADIHAAIPVFDPGYPQPVRDEDVAVAVHLDDEVADLKLAALRSQATQVQPVIDVIGEERFRRWWLAEWFRAANR
jgi:hypothetical protein